MSLFGPYTECLQIFCFDIKIAQKEEMPKVSPLHSPPASPPPSFSWASLAGLVSLGVSAATAGASADASVSIGSTAADASELGFSSAGLDSALVPKETSAAGVSAALTGAAADSEEG